MCASEVGYVEIVEVLLQHHANVNMQNKDNVRMLLRMICICQLMSLDCAYIKINQV